MAKREDVKFYHINGETTICIITDKVSGMQFFGEAKWDHTGEYNERTGDFLAEQRAIINMFRYVREQARAIEKSYKITYADISQIKDFNPKSKEAKAIRRNIYECKQVRKELNNIITETKESLKYYIATREALIRAKTGN